MGNVGLESLEIRLSRKGLEGLEPQNLNFAALWRLPKPSKLPKPTRSF